MTKRLTAADVVKKCNNGCLVFVSPAGETHVATSPVTIDLHLEKIREAIQSAMDNAAAGQESEREGRQESEATSPFNDDAPALEAAQKIGLTYQIAKDDLAEVRTLDELEKFRVKHLGLKGGFRKAQQLLSALRECPGWPARLNSMWKELQSAFEDKGVELSGKVAPKPGAAIKAENFAFPQDGAGFLFDVPGHLPYIIPGTIGHFKDRLQSIIDAVRKEEREAVKQAPESPKPVSHRPFDDLRRQAFIDKAMMWVMAAGGDRNEVNATAADAVTAAEALWDERERRRNGEQPQKQGRSNAEIAKMIVRWMNPSIDAGSLERETFDIERILDGSLKVFPEPKVASRG